MEKVLLRRFVGARPKVADLTVQGKLPGLDVVLVGDNPASAVYVRNKEKACREIGINSTIHRLSEATTRRSFWV